MAFKFIVDKLEDVEEAHRPLYVKDDTTGKYRLPVDGVVAKERVDEFRNTNILVMKERDELAAKLKGVDLDEYMALKAEAQKNKDKKLIDAGKIDELLEQRVGEMRKSHETLVNGLTQRLTATTSRLETVLIDNELQRAAVDAGVLDTALDDVVWRGRQVFRLKEDKVIPMDGDKVIYGADGTSVLSIKDWLSQLVVKAPHLFKQSKGGGAGNGGGGTGGAGSVSKKSELKTAADKAAYIAKNGANAYLALPA